MAERNITKNAMLDAISRHYVQAIRECSTIRVVVNDGQDNELTLCLNSNRGGQKFKRLKHDIALAFQDSFNN